MPLTAYLYSQKIIAPRLNENEWRHIKSALKQNPNYLHFPCCQSPVYCRVSKKGLQHFVHKNTDNCSFVGESEDHLLLKMEIYNTCQKLGWNTDIEFSGKNFRADVLASDNKHEIAFEIQLTRQDLQTTMNRQRTFARAAIRCAWLFKHVPKDYRPKKELPVFRLEINHDDTKHPYKCHISEKAIPISEFVELLLGGKIKFRKKLTIKKEQTADIYLFDEHCWKCGYLYKAIGSCSVLKSKCGAGIANAGFEIYDLGAGAVKLMAALKNEHANLADFARYYSRTMKADCWANYCPQCKAVLGQGFLNKRIIGLTANDIKPIKRISYAISDKEHPESIDFPHWCLEGTEGFC